MRNDLNSDTAPLVPTTRIPNLFHLLILLALTLLSVVLCELALVALHPHDYLKTFADQRLQLFVNIATYALALAAAALVFPLLWRRAFLNGISWNPARATFRLIPLGLALGFVSQGVSTLLPIPKQLPIEKIFHTPGIIWVLALFGTVVAPLFEEIVFRGFLLPGVAILVDFFRLPLSPDHSVGLETLLAWRASDAFSRPALLISSLVTSVLFALIHAPQLGFSLPALALLMTVSLVLCYIRIRTGSVAASTLVHACYNLSVFLLLFLVTGGFRHMDKL